VKECNSDNCIPGHVYNCRTDNFHYNSRCFSNVCFWEGDPALRYGWNYLDGLPYNQPGPDYATTWAGGSITRTLGPYNAAASWLPAGCHAIDTLCFEAVSQHGWTLTGDPAFDYQLILGPGYFWYQDVTITAPCSAHIGDQDMVIARCVYVNHAGVCDFTCGDCHDPDTCPADGLFYYSADTLYVTIVASPPAALGIVQDTLTLVERGQTQAYIPFQICNQDECAPSTRHDYNIKSRGHVGAALNTTGFVMVPGGECRDVYGVLNAGTTPICTHDTLTIIVWTGSPAVYDTCVQRVHVIAPLTVPLFTAPVVTILVLALILAAAVFMRRRAVSRA